MKTKALIVLAAAMSLVAAAQSQNIHYGDSFELNETLVSNQSHEYTASSYIDLNRGFYSAPNSSHSTLLQIDSYGINPPATGITGGPNSYDTGVVGAIGGTVDVGSMGAAIYSIPIDLPAGINGMQPNLSITYNSQAGNGLLGWGWDLTGLSSIERTGRTRYHDGTTGAVTLNDNTDRYMLDGKRLIEVADYTDSIEYRIEQDEMSKIMAYFRFEQGGSTYGYGTIKILDHFKVWKSDGTTLEYGTSNDTQINLQGSSNACCWLLRQMTDRNGNYIVYHFDINNMGYRLSYIDYTGNSSQSPLVTPLFRVLFSYNSRLDADISIIGQKKLKHSDLLESIGIYKKDSFNQYFELKKYEFEYYDVDRATGFFYTRLKKIKYSQGQECVNPTIINWSQHAGYYGALLSMGFNTIGNGNAFNNSVKFPGDFNGDGYTDVIVTRQDNGGGYSWAEVYLNQGGENTIDFNYVTGFNLNDSVDWIHVADFNGDGKDDFVITDRQKRSWPWRDLLTMNVYLSHVNNNTLSFIHLPQLGPYKIKRDYNESILIGDFLGTGKDYIIVQASQQDDDHPGQFNYDKAFCLVCSTDETEMTVCQFDEYLPSFRLLTADFNGDGSTEIMYLTEDEYWIKKLQVDGNSFTYVLSSSGVALDDSYDCYLGDFNGDGKTDVLSCHVDGNNEPVWKISFSGGAGFAESESIIGNFGLGYLGPTHYFSLKKRQLYPYYVQVADFNGDGYDDIKHPCFNDVYDQQFYFCPVVDSGSYEPFSGKKQLHAYNGPHSNMETCLGCFRGKETCDDLGDGEIYYLVSVLDLYNVNRIIDGHDNKTDFTYDYLMQEPGSQNTDAFYTLDRSEEDLQHRVMAIATPTKALKKITTWNVKGTPVNSSYRYGGILFHDQGKGFLGLTSITNTESVTITENGSGFEDVVRSSERHYGFHATNPIIYLAPSYQRAYDGNGTLLSEVTYDNSACINFRSENHKSFIPFVTRTTTMDFNPNNGNFLKRSITEFVHGKDGISNQYYNFVRLSKVRNGITDNQNITDINDCEFRSLDSTVYYNNNYSTWTINRLGTVFHTQSRNGKPDVSHFEKYEYTAANSYLPSHVYDSPSDISDHDPLMLRTDFEYYSDGNLMEKVVLVPYGQFGEQQKTYEYEYGPDGQRRLVTNETVSSGGLSYATSYTYDDYDRIDTLTEANGLAKTFDSDAMGITSWIHNADSTKSCTALRWAQGHSLAPSGASYYRWSRSSDGKQTMTFYHKTGAELRSVTYGLRGEPIFTDRQYDNRGRLSAVSEPYKEGETVRWTVYGYDNIDRLTSVTTPDTTCTTTVYDGFRTETTVTTPQGLSQESAVTVNAMGWTVRSDDASGSYVVYDHYADGLMATATVNGNPATTVTASYDNARQRATLVDPDYGTLTTSYDAYGRLKQSVSPRELAAQTETANFYDGFDRLIQTTDGMENTRTDYTYNETGVTKGTLNEMRFRVQGGADIQRITYSYDTLARPVSATEQRATGSYTTNVEYDTQSRISRMVYPSGVAVRYGYQNGYWKSVFDDNDQLLWKTKNMDARGQLLEVELGNGAVTRHTYDTVMHRLRSIVTEKNLQNLTYDYDKFGNLAARKDSKKNLEETFTYDDMNRLTGITLKRSSGQDLNCAVVYDALGRMTSKQAVTAVSNVPQVSTIFSQPAFNTSKVHALSTIQSTSDLFLSSAQVVTYTGFDKVRSVRNGNDSIRYAYGYDHQRIRMEERIGTNRTKDYVGSCEYVAETLLNTTIQTLNTYLVGPFGVFAVVTMAGDEAYHYVLKDNLGSWVTITDKNGAVEQQLSYDAWGNLRNPNNWANYTLNDIMEKPMFDRGFTGHEHLCHFSLINMNGRMYDPVTSSFLSADRYVQDPTSAQGFNRYAYCMCNPLRFVDPTGLQMKKPAPGRTSSSDLFYRDPYAYADSRGWEPRDFRGAGYMYNMAFNSNAGGSGGGSCNYYGSYGYYVSYYANSVNNYCFPSAQLQLIHNWQNNPSYSTNKEMREAGISGLTVGELYGSLSDNPGYRNSYYTWTDSNGRTHNAAIYYEYVGGNTNGVLTLSNQRLWLYALESSLEKANILAQSTGVPMGTISELVEMAAKSYHNVPLLKVSSRLSQAQKITALSKEGASLLKVSKGLGHFCAGVSVGISGYQTYNYYANGGTGYEVLTKGVVDVGMVVVGVFGGPVGLGISIGYFVLDLSTDGFGVSYEIKP